MAHPVLKKYLASHKSGRKAGVYAASALRVERLEPRLVLAGNAYIASDTLTLSSEDDILDNLEVQVNYQLAEPVDGAKEFELDYPQFAFNEQGNIAVGPKPETWSSYDIFLRDDGTDPDRIDAEGTIRADILGSQGTNAEIRLYQTQNGFSNPNFDIDQAIGNAIHIYEASPPNTNYADFEVISGPAWYTRLSGFAQYIGQSGIDRGEDDSGLHSSPTADEDAGPLPALLPGSPENIQDIAWHTEVNGDQLIVVAFVAPEAGDYQLENFAGRRWSTVGDTSTRARQTGIRVFGPDGEWIGDPNSEFFQGAGAGDLVVQRLAFWSFT